MRGAPHGVHVASGSSSAALRHHPAWLGYGCQPVQPMRNSIELEQFGEHVPRETAALLELESRRELSYEGPGPASSGRPPA